MLDSNTVTRLVPGLAKLISSDNREGSQPPNVHYLVGDREQQGCAEAFLGAVAITWQKVAPNPDISRHPWLVSMYLSVVR